MNDLELERKRYVTTFAVSFGLGAVTRLLSHHMDSYAGQHPPGWLVAISLAAGVGAIAAGVYLIFRTFKFAKALGSSTAGACGWAFMSVVPLLNLVSVALLLRRFSKRSA